ncbi:MAG TPA: ABC transporter ATP-binding protein [Nitrosopumilaceae archaeon]|nr:ABC transporter ATP-binding protein [Nitrosopumilaceae archaeon]
MANNDAIILKNISKKFLIYHENRDSMYGYLTSIINKKKSSDELVVLDDISFSVKRGEMLGIIGFNGSGKTTLLKIIAKIYTPDKGSVITNGTVTPLLALGTGFNQELSARENIITYGVILGFTKKEMIEKIGEIVRFAELDKFLDTKVKNFSAGMNARLTFSTAIQVDPDILLLDEVLSVGDILFREKSFNALMDFRKKGKTIVFVSHQIDHVAKLCDKVIWLHDGKIRDYGQPDDVIKKYRQFAGDKSKAI